MLSFKICSKLSSPCTTVKIQSSLVQEVAYFVPGDSPSRGLCIYAQENFGGKPPTALCRRDSPKPRPHVSQTQPGLIQLLTMEMSGDEALSECHLASDSLEELNSCCEAVQELSSYLSEDLDTLATKHGLDVEGFLFGDQEEDSSCMSKYSLWTSDNEETPSTPHIDNSPITDGIADLDAYDAITTDVFASSPCFNLLIK